MIIADTGFWIALLFRSDNYHPQAAAAYQRYGDQLITTWPILTETCHLLRRHVDPQAPAALMDQASTGFQVWELPQRAPQQAAALMRRYLDLPMDLADASAVLLAEHLGHGRILSTDRRDFTAYRWKEHRPFQNLLLID